MSENQEFDRWNEVKKSLSKRKNPPSIKEGEVWWHAAGKNIGVEVNGKDLKFARPVLILKKMSRLGFLGIPLTSQYHQGEWYVRFDFLNKTQFANLSQARTMSTLRLYNKMGTVPDSDLELVRQGFKNLFCS